jgi:hypothetical protein
MIQDLVQLRMLKCFHLNERFGAHGDLPNTLKKKDSNIIFKDNFSWVSQSMQFVEVRIANIVVSVLYSNYPLDHSWPSAGRYSSGFIWPRKYLL